MRNAPDRLPPLDLLLSFDAAARHLSFTRAAQERFVTQSAISRQIRSLEDDLGVALFRRGHRAIVLTDEGRLLHDACGDALARLRETTERLRAGPVRQVLTLTTTPGVAGLWLIPRLAAFTRAHPGVDVRIDASFDRRDFARDGIDIAIRYTSASSTAGTKLFDEEVLPVCSPSLLAAGDPLRVPSDLTKHTLLQVGDAGGSPLPEWQPWLTAVGVPDLEPRAVLTFNSYDSLISAAAHGQGVALGRRPLIDALLADGRLVAPFEGSLASPYAYFVIVAPGSSKRAPVKALARWLCQEGCASDPVRAQGCGPIEVCATAPECT